METRFTDEQRQLPRIQMVDEILRKCVHCGFCTATCPTYVLKGDELDSPRGRIYLIREMFESGKPANAEVTLHLDRCLSCLSCMTTCPSGVDYMHLVDEARAFVEETGKRPLFERLLRASLSVIIPYPKRFGPVMVLSRLAAPLAGLAGIVPGMKPVGAMLALAKGRPDKTNSNPSIGVHPAIGEKKGRVGLLVGCAQQNLRPSINAATVRLLNRLGVEVIIPGAQVCCGSLEHHLGRENHSLAKARTNIAAFMQEIEGEGLDAIIINASGCGTTVKDYGHMLRLDNIWRERAQKVSQLTLDISEYLCSLDFSIKARVKDAHITYHAPCSMQHGQKIKTQPVDLLRRAGFVVREPGESHLCCGSAGVYNIFQSEIADQLKARKLDNIAETDPQFIATGNIGCITQLQTGTDIPVVHMVELLDWATGGPKPKAGR